MSTSLIASLFRRFTTSTRGLFSASPTVASPPTAASAAAAAAATGINPHAVFSGGSQQQVTTVPQSQTFPKVTVPMAWTGLPVEVSLIAQLPRGLGDLFIDGCEKRQLAHPTYIDEFNESSARICDTKFPSEVTAVYTFLVGKVPLVFHRHEGHRAIMGISGSAGAEMRFSAASLEEALESPKQFLEKLFVVEIPPDTFFNLRFNGMVYHQFAPVKPEHHAFFAISVHTNEAGGNLDAERLAKVLNNEGTIPLLTEPIPEGVEHEMLVRGDVWRTAKRYRFSAMTN